MEKSVKYWEIIGIVFISLVGSLFHFIFELSNYNIVVASFSAVNESVWEHLKLTFFPLLIFSMIEFNFVRESTENFIIAKAVAAYTMPIIIVILFYSYTAFTGTHILIIDLIIFYSSVIIGQLLSYTILGLEKKPKVFFIISWCSIIFLMLIFVFFTYFPPEFPIFQDQTTSQYGIAMNHH